MWQQDTKVNPKKLKKGRKGRRNRLKGVRERGTLEKEKTPIFGTIQRGGEDVARIQGALRQLIITVEEQGIIPFNNLDIKKMKGEWEGFYRLRVGKNRAVFTVRIDSGEVDVYTIGARGDFYN